MRGWPRCSGGQMSGSAAEVFRALALGLDSLGARWYLIGAQAVVVWGRPRFTEDIDLTVVGTPRGSKELIGALSGVGFRLRFDDVANFVAQTWVLPLEHVGTKIPVDLVLGASGLEAEFLSRARRVEIGGVSVPVISPEDLVVSKILAGRPKDLEDVLGVLQLRGEQMDLAAIQKLLTTLEQALDQSDLLPLLESVCRRARVTLPGRP